MKTGCGFGLHPVFLFLSVIRRHRLCRCKTPTERQNKKGLSAFIKSYLSQSLFQQRTFVPRTERPIWLHLRDTDVFVCDCEIRQSYKLFTIIHNEADRINDF